MNKRITSLALAFVMVLSLLANAVPVLAAPTDPLVTFTVEADKTSANANSAGAKRHTERPALS